MTQTYELANAPYYRQPENVTIVTIKKEHGQRYSYEQAGLSGDRTHEGQEVLIQAVLDVIKAELDPANAIVQTQAKLEENQAKLEQAEQQIAHNKSEQDRLVALANKIDKVVRVMAQDSIMGEKVSYGTTYKEMVELFPLAEVGKVYEPGAIFVVEDPSHAEINGEGKRILIQTNQSFTYQGETLAQLEGTPYQNGVLAPWKFNAPKATIVQ